jgi:hypothetical protein
MRESKIEIVHRARVDRQSRADSLSIALSIALSIGAVVLIIAASVGACGNTERSRAAAA